MGTVVAILLIVLVVAMLAVYMVMSIKQVPEAQVYVIERFGQFKRLLQPGLRMIVPFMERVHLKLDMRVRPLDIEKQSVITKDDLIVDIDSVVYLQVTDAKAAAYQVSDYERAVRRLVVTNLRNFVGEMEFDAVLSSRDDINSRLREVLDSATGDWGLRVSRVELREILPPPELQEMLQKQARAEREKRARILEAKGKASYVRRITAANARAKVVTARAEAAAKIKIADADAEAKKRVAQGQADAIATVFEAIHKGHPDQQLLAYSYLQTLPEIAQGGANKLWIVPSELGHALEGVGNYFGSHEAGAGKPGEGNGGSAESGGSQSEPAPGGTPSSHDGGGTEPRKVRLVTSEDVVVPEQRRNQ